MSKNDASKKDESLVMTQSALTRAALLDAYQKEHRELREKKKHQHKVVIIANMRKRHLHAMVRQHVPTKDLFGSRNHHNHRQQPGSAAAAKRKHQLLHEENTGKMNYLQKFLHQHGLTRSDSTRFERPEGWAAAKVNRAMRRYYMMQLMSTQRLPKYLNAQNKKLFEECCKCRPLADGPSMSVDDGVLQLAGPNLPKILRILRSKKNTGIDLLQPHGIAQHTVMHVAAQRGYLELVRELMEHWTAYPTESPHQSYSIALLHRLLDLLLQLRRAKVLVSESHSDLREVVAQIGVPFAHFSEALDKLHDDAITLHDLLRICGHPLVLSKDASGNTPLHYAAEGGYLALCELLITNGANINAQNKSGETPLHFAISSSHQDVCMYFVRNRADVRVCRYVTLTLANNVTILGTFIDAPSGSAICKVMPVLQPRSSNGGGGGFALRTDAAQTHSWFRPRIVGNRRFLRHGQAVISPEVPLSPHSKEVAATAAVSSGSNALPPNAVDEGMYTRVESLSSSPLFRGRSPRDVVYFRTAPGSSLIKPNVLCVLLVGDHVTASEVVRVREVHDRGKLFHLLIQNLPEVAVVAMDSFRTPLFRCSLAKRVREFNQRWVVNNRLKTARERHSSLLLLMKGARVPNETIVKRQKQRRRETQQWLLNAIWRGIKKVYKTLRRLRSALSVQNVFAATESEAAHKDDIICEPKGILYEYVYDHAEFRGGWSPTLELVVETENKELMEHPWVKQLMDHKWHSFASQTFRSEFHLYFVYFVAVFVSTYLHIGDAYVGMPIGGYRSSIFTMHATWAEYVRDAGRFLYSLINAFYTYDEIRSYRELGSIRAYLRDGWNWFDLVQILCVWMLLATDVIEMLSPDDASSPDFQLVVLQDSLYSTSVWRRYNLRITLMSIVGPQVFIRWIRFARGNLTLGPFVRMIFKMFKDIALFLLVFGVFLFGFAFAFFILQLEGFRSYFGAILSVFQISLGAWDWDVIYEGGPIAIMFFIAYTIIGTIMLLNLLIAMLGNTYDKIWEDRLFFFELERAKATISIQTALNDNVYDERYLCQQLYVLEGDRPIEGIQLQRF